MTIREKFLYGLVKIETSPWTATLSWTDQTASLVNGISYSQGGRVGVPGTSSVDVGTLTATFKNLSTVPGVGALVRISFADVAGYAFVGYVQDVGQRVVFDNTVSYTTPVILTTLYCVDWVGYAAQFNIVGVGGANYSTGTDETDSIYGWNDRVAAINKVIDATYATKLVTAVTSGSIPNMGDTDLVGNTTAHLDLIADTAQTYWYGTNVLPTNITTGRTGLVEVRSLASLVSSGKTFTDLAGSAGQLHYTEIDLENSTQNVANTIVLNNRARLHLSDPEITQIGGFNEQNFVVVNNQNVIGVGVDRVQTATDASSVTTYGVRQADFYTNCEISNITDANFIANGSAEYGDDGYSGGLNIAVRRRRPSEEASPFTAKAGEWAIRATQTSSNTVGTVKYRGSESDGTPIVPGTSYKFSAWGARGLTSRTDARFFVQFDWRDEEENTISTSSGSSVNLTTAKTWYQASVTATAPSGAYRAVLEIVFDRPGGSNLSRGDNYWVDSLMFSKFGTTTYFDGDTPWTDAVGYVWTGGVGTSPSVKITNSVDDAATAILANYASTSMRVSRIRWNAQEDLTAVPALTVGKTISLVYKGTTTTYRIVGVNGTIDADRYMIDYYLIGT